jgi:hypothetical protein
MSDGNKNRTYKIFESLYYSPLSYHKNALKSNYQSHIIDVIKNQTIKLIDSTTISLCLAMFDWAIYRTAKGDLKIHTVLDDTLGLPDIINITEAKLHDSKGLLTLVFSKGTIIVEDRAYFYFDLIKQRCAAKNDLLQGLKKTPFTKA